MLHSPIRPRTMLAGVGSENAPGPEPNAVPNPTRSRSTAETSRGIIRAPSKMQQTLAKPVPPNDELA